MQDIESDLLATWKRHQENLENDDIHHNLSRLIEVCLFNIMQNEIKYKQNIDIIPEYCTEVLEEAVYRIHTFFNQTRDSLLPLFKEEKGSLSNYIKNYYDGAIKTIRAELKSLSTKLVNINSEDYSNNTNNNEFNNDYLTSSHSDNTTGECITIDNSDYILNEATDNFRSFQTSLLSEASVIRVGELNNVIEKVFDNMLSNNHDVINFDNLTNQETNELIGYLNKGFQDFDVRIAKKWLGLENGKSYTEQEIADNTGISRATIKRKTNAMFLYIKAHIHFPEILKNMQPNRKLVSIIDKSNFDRIKNLSRDKIEEIIKQQNSTNNTNKHYLLEKLNKKSTFRELFSIYIRRRNEAIEERELISKVLK